MNLREERVVILGQCWCSVMQKSLWNVREGRLVILGECNCRELCESWVMIGYVEQEMCACYDMGGQVRLM